MAKARTPVAKKKPTRKVAAKRAPVKPRPKPVKQREAPKKKRMQRDVLEEIGFDVLVEMIAKGKSLRNICACPDAHLTPGTHCERRVLMRFLTSTEERKAEFERARQLAAIEFDERGDRLLAAAQDELQLKKAAHRAHHYRWRAERISPDYNPTKKVAVSGGISVHMNIKYVADA